MRVLLGGSMAVLALFLGPYSSTWSYAVEFPLSLKAWSATVIKIERINSSNASMVGEVKNEDAVEYCERDPAGVTTEYAGTLTKAQCVEQLMSDERGKKYTASADCSEKTISSSIGSFTLIGQTIGDDIPKYIWRDNKTGEVFDGGGFGDALVAEAQFKMLCPSVLKKTASSSREADEQSPPQRHTNEGNFERLYSLTKGNMKMEPIGENNGYSTLRNKLTGITISDKNCEGYICESILSGNPVTQMDQIRIHLAVIYLSVQDTLRLRGFPYPQFDLTIDTKRDELLKKILGNFSLQSGMEKRTTFQFDRINVDASWITPSDQELRRGKEPGLTIRLTIA
jgi:hypothetical protein